MRSYLAGSQLHDTVPDGLDAVKVVHLGEDVQVPLSAGERILDTVFVKHVAGRELTMRHVGQLQRQQPGDVQVVDPEERNVVGGAMHADCHVCRHDESAAGAVGRVRVIRPLFSHHLQIVHVQPSDSAPQRF